MDSTLKMYARSPQQMLASPQPAHSQQAPVPEPPQPLKVDKERIAREVKLAAMNPESQESSLWRMRKFAEGMCGAPCQAVKRMYGARNDIETIFRKAHRLSTREGLPPRILGRKLAQTWMSAKNRRAFTTKLLKLEEADTVNYAGLLQYLEMVVALVPDVSAPRLQAVWELHEPRWSKIERKCPTVMQPEKPPEPETKEPEPPKEEEQAKEEEEEALPETVHKECQEWCMSRSFKVAAQGDERVFLRKGIDLMSGLSSIRAAVEVLNKKASKQTCVIVHSEVNKCYYCLYPKGERRAALHMLGMDEPCGFLTISVVAAFNLSNASGMNVKSSDPYAVVRVGREQYRTASEPDNLHPVWNSDDFQFSVNKADDQLNTVTVEIMDENPGGLDVSMGYAEFRLKDLETNERHRRTVQLENGGVGQVEVEIEFVQKVEYGSRHPPNLGIADCRPKHRRAKPAWHAVEKEMIYDREINSFLSNLRPPSKNSVKGGGNPHGYQAKLHAYVHKGLDQGPDPTKVCQHCGNLYMWKAIFCQTCGTVRPGQEEAAKEEIAKLPESVRPGATPSLGNTLLDSLSDEDDLEGKFIQEGTVLRCVAEVGQPVLDSETKNELGKIPYDGIVRATGPVTKTSDQILIPIFPAGTVTLDTFVKAEGYPNEPIGLTINIIQVKGIKRSALKGTANLSVLCSVPGKKKISAQTTKIKAVDPEFNEVLEITGYEAGDILEFTIRDTSKLFAEATMGTGRIGSNEIWPDGFDDSIPLGVGDGSLKVSVQPRKLSADELEAVFKEGYGSPSASPSASPKGSPSASPPESPKPSLKGDASSATEAATTNSSPADASARESQAPPASEAPLNDQAASTESPVPPKGAGSPIGGNAEESSLAAEPNPRASSSGNPKRILKASSRVKVTDPDSD